MGMFLIVPTLMVLFVGVPIALIAFVIFASVRLRTKRGRWWVYFLIVIVTSLVAYIYANITYPPVHRAPTGDDYANMAMNMAVTVMGPLAGMVLGLFSLIQGPKIKPKTELVPQKPADPDSDELERNLSTHRR